MLGVRSSRSHVRLLGTARRRPERARSRPRAGCLRPWSDVASTTRKSGAATFKCLRRLRDAIAQPLPRLALVDSVTSPADAFQKMVFRTADELVVETVLIPLHKPGAVSVCLSSQVGCPMGCVFCATARMPRRRNLEMWEIVDQFVWARQTALAQGRRVTGAVFMGMGEPFLNLRPRTGCCRFAALSVGWVGWRQGDHDQHGRIGPRDRPVHGGASAISSRDQPGRGHRRQARLARAAGKPHADRPSDGCRPSPRTCPA